MKMKTIFLGTIILLPCLLIFNESEYAIVNLIGALYIGLIYVLVTKCNRFKQFFVDFGNELDYYNDKIFKL